MSTLAHVFEAEGIATVALGSIRKQIESSALNLTVLIVNAKSLTDRLDGGRLAYLEVAVATVVLLPVVVVDRYGG